MFGITTLTIIYGDGLDCIPAFGALFDLNGSNVDCSLDSITNQLKWVKRFPILTAQLDNENILLTLWHFCWASESPAAFRLSASLSFRQTRRDCYLGTCLATDWF